MNLPAGGQLRQCLMCLLRCHPQYGRLYGLLLMIRILDPIRTRVLFRAGERSLPLHLFRTSATFAPSGGELNPFLRNNFSPSIRMVGSL